MRMTGGVWEAGVVHAGYLETRVVWVVGGGDGVGGGGGVMRECISRVGGRKAVSKVVAVRLVGSVRVVGFGQRRHTNDVPLVGAGAAWAELHGGDEKERGRMGEGEREGGYVSCGCVKLSSV